jgi:CHAT domain-containing protein
VDRRVLKYCSTASIVMVAMLGAIACSNGRESDSARASENIQRHIRQAELDHALQLAEQELAAASPQDQSETIWNFRLLKAEILLARADLASAAPLLQHDVPQEFVRLAAQQEYLQAKAQVLQGTLAPALDTLDRARAIDPQAQDLHLDIEILAGQIRLRLGQWHVAEARLADVVSRAKTQGDAYRQALALNNLGMGRLIRGRFDEALTWFEQVLTLPRLDRTSVYAAALNNAGLCYSRLGDLERAVAVQQKAVEIQRGGSRIAYQSALGELGTTHLLRQEHDLATKYLEEAFAVAKQSQLSTDATVWANNLAALHLDNGRFDEAERLNEEARRLNPPERAAKLVLNTLHAARIAQGRGQRDAATRLFTEVLRVADSEPAVRWSAHAGLANVAAASGQPERASRHFELALEIIQKTRSDLLKTDYKLAFLTRLVSFFQDYVEWLVAQKRIDKALETADSSRARVLAELHGAQATRAIDARSLQRLSAESGTTFLAYWLAPRASSLWIVNTAGIRRVSLPPAKEIENLVRQHQSTIHNALVNPLAQPDSAGERLYRLLVEPASTALRPGARVVIVPDGALHRLNFETLPVTGPSPHYWIEDVEIQIAPSLSLLAVRRETTPANASMLLIGDANGREPEFPALRYASAEMTNVAKHFAAGSVTAHRKDRAVPEAYRDAPLERFSLIHFTAHALANTESPLDSAIMLSGPRESFKLYARDVADRPLNADLVTVSACRSAGERTYSGEGLVGFSWAFLRAGARRVIAGLWDVDDRSTADLMDRTYAAIARGASPVQALRSAKLALLKAGGTYAKPYYWGPFEVFTVVVEVKQSKSGIRPTQAHLHAPAATTRTPQAL